MSDSTINKGASNHRIAKNTLMLYIRMFLMMAITLYTSRVVLQVLGVQDFGIYNVVGGFVVAFSVLTNALSGAVMRFTSFELGRGDMVRLKDIVSTSINIQLYLAVAVIFIGEIVGIWFLNSKMNIPMERMFAANLILQFSIFTFVIRLLYVPFNALIISHENMSIYAYLSVIEVILQLAIVYLLKILPFDKLELYGLFIMIVALIILLMYIIYCKKNYEECTYSTKFSKNIFKEMSGFASWNFIGTSAGILKNYGVDIIVNIFYGVTLNAARGIAMQVNTAISKFTQNFMTALNPQIVKSYAEEDFQRLDFLIQQGTRFAFYLMLIITLPILFEMNKILEIWLVNVPAYAVLFTQLQVLNSLIAILSSTLIMAMLATGNIRNYQIMVGSLSMFNFPISWICLYIGLPVYITYLISIVIEFACFAGRLYMANKIMKINVKMFLNDVLLNVIKVSIISSLVPIIIAMTMDDNMLRFILIFVSCVCFTIISILFIGLKNAERQFILNKIRAISRR